MFNVVFDLFYLSFIKNTEVHGRIYLYELVQYECHYSRITCDCTTSYEQFGWYFFSIDMWTVLLSNEVYDVCMSTVQYTRILFWLVVPTVLYFVRYNIVFTEIHVSF